MAIKPILFDTEMVRAILDGQKTCTSRLVKPQPDEKHTFPLGFVTDSTENKEVGCFGFGIDEYGGSIQYIKPPYQPVDILYVRETWYKGLERYIYRADYSDTEKFYRDGKEIEMKWQPFIHMPKEAARIWLKVTDVRVERLQEITPQGAWKEGARCSCLHPVPDCAGNKTTFVNIWTSTIKKSDIDRYGWDANPWVWVIEFERCEKPEGV